MMAPQSRALVSPMRNGDGEAGQGAVHGLRADARQNEGDVLTHGGPHGLEQPGRGEARVGDPGRAPHEGPIRSFLTRASDRTTTMIVRAVS